MGRWANKYVIGLTGNIATGKSLVRKMLENLGAFTLDADSVAHQAMMPGGPNYAPVVEYFGKWILDGDKKIDRNKLGAVAFASAEALNLLEKITHPVIGQAIDILISRARQPIVVVEAIKMVDGPLGGQVDSIWVVDAPPDQQVQRLITKRGMPDAEARRRVESQNPQQDKLARANVIIRNNGSPDDVWTQVQAEWQHIFQGARPAAASAPQPAPPPPAPPPIAQAAPPAAPPGAPPARPATSAAPIQAPPPAPAQRQPAPPPVPPVPPVPMPPVQSTPPAPPAAAQPPPAPSLQAPAQPAQTVATSPVRPAQPPPSSAGISSLAFDVRRGGPRNADAIARLLSQATGRQLGRNDVMLAFGEKSYVLAETGARIIGLAGFQVENLITRVDEFYVVADVPLAPVAALLINEVEEASKELQSEVGFIFVPRTAPPNLLQAFFAHGYERIEIETLRVPAWREAAQEMQTPERQVLMKKLRAERILKPV